MIREMKERKQFLHDLKRSSEVLSLLWGARRVPGGFHAITEEDRLFQV